LRVCETKLAATLRQRIKQKAATRRVTSEAMRKRVLTQGSLARVAIAPAYQQAEK